VIRDACQFAQKMEMSEYGKPDQNLGEEFFMDNLRTLREIVLDYPRVSTYLCEEFLAVILSITKMLNTLNFQDSVDLRNFAEQILNILDAMIKQTGVRALEDETEVNIIGQICLYMVYSLKPVLMLPCISILSQIVRTNLLENELFEDLCTNQFTDVVLFTLKNSLNKKLIDNVWYLLDGLFSSSSFSNRNNSHENIGCYIPLLATIVNGIQPESLVADSTVPLICFIRILISVAKITENQQQFFEQYSGTIRKVAQLIHAHFSNNLINTDENYADILDQFSQLILEPSGL